MDIPDWSVWIFLGLVVLQVLGLVPVIHRLREIDSAARSKARFDLVETIGALLLFSGGLLSAVVAESWLWISVFGFVIMAVGYAVKGVHLLRARRRPTA
ncbi:hypothetical protein [Streptomyces sp. NPDC002328]|uniref:hypothetical protein n=1 Tax=Streptomyces sp. NPDC002328 TaxID=3364642 RepID=UPI0036A2BD0E